MSWWRRRTTETTTPGNGGRPDGRSDAARRARAESESALRDVAAQWPDVRQVVDQLRQLREHNHFGELIAESMRRRGRP